MHFPVRLSQLTKIRLFLICVLVSLVPLHCLLFIQRNDGTPDRNRLQEGFASSLQPSRPLSSDVNTTDWMSLQALASVPICSRQEPFDLSLCVPTSEAITYTTETVERRCHPEYEIFYSRRSRCISYDMLQQMPVRMFARARRPAIYMIYPQDVHLPSVLQAVRNNRSITTAPINNPKLVLIRTSQSICRINETEHRARYELIIIVKSSPINAARRSRLRRLIRKQTSKMSSSVGLLFSLGVPADTVNRSRLLDAISDEATRFDDIILTDFLDTYYNLTFKTLLNIRFAHVACGDASPLFAFMDDDHGLNVPALLDYFHTFDRDGKHRGQLRRSVFGKINKRAWVIRQPGHKWAIKRSEFPLNMYSGYPAGPCYFIGAEAVAALSIATAFTKSFPLEDVYVGLTAVKLGIKMHDLPGMHIHGPRQYAQIRRPALVASLEYFEKHII